MSRLQANVADDTVERLVEAMMGRKDPAASSLAHRVLGSQIGAHSDSDRKQLDVKSNLRRISRRSGPSVKEEVQILYNRLENESSSVNDDVPSKMLAVLTKLMGKHMNLPETTPAPKTANPEPPVPVKEVHAPAPQVKRSPRVVDVPVTSPRQTRSTHQSPTTGRITTRPQEIPTNRARASPIHHYQQQHSRTHHSAVPLHPPPATAEELAQERQELEMEEALLMRECLYSLQGIDGERIRYYRADPRHHIDHDESKTHVDVMDQYEGVRVKSPALSNALLYTGRILQSRLGTGATDALRIVGEAGWLYQRIQSYIHKVQNDESMGVVARAFCGTLTEELREYHSLLTQFESKLNSLSLRQLMVDLRLPTARLKILAMLTDGLGGLTGGHLLTGLQKHSLHGDTRHAQLVQTMLLAASRPWFDMLYLWTTQGVLSDPHNEFFVQEFPGVQDKLLWNEKYRIHHDQIPPGLLQQELVLTAFNVGKGINFIRRCLLDGQWTMYLGSSEMDDDTTAAGTVDDGLNNDLGYRYKPQQHDNATLQRTLSRAAQLVHSHILQALMQDNHMMDHLFALKQFLFLGQGDFFSALVEGLHSEFSGQVGVVGIYKHSLLGIVEGALRSTNAKFLPQYVLDRLQVELVLDPADDTNHMFGPGLGTTSNEDQRTVWDIFMLDYQIPDPLVAIAHPAALEKYKLVFSLLFRLKRLEFMLNYTWRQSATLHHALQTYAQYNGIQVSTSSTYSQAEYLLRKISILRSSMIHLIVNLKSYLMFEVLEGGWRRLESEMEKAQTLDEVIESHERYLSDIVRKSLLRAKSDDLKQLQLAGMVENLVNVAAEFCTLQETVFHNSLVAADVSAEKRMQAASRQQQGRWGFDSERDIAEEEHFFGLADMGILNEVIRIATVYNEHALTLLQALNDKVNSNPEDYMLDNGTQNDPMEDPTLCGTTSSALMMDLEEDLDPQRFLIAQLDHNNFYGAQVGK